MWREDNQEKDMNNYEKMTLKSFTESLKAKKYAHPTAARRAVGKSTELSNAEKDKARAEINKFFGVTAGAAPKKAAKKVQTKTKSAPKKAAKKEHEEKHAMAKKAEEADAMGRIMAHAYVQELRKIAPPPHGDKDDKKDKDKDEEKKAPSVKRQPVAPRSELSAQSTDARVMRQHAASQVFTALYGKAPLEPSLEAQLLRTSALEYLANSGLASSESPSEATPAINQKERVRQPRVSVAKAAPAPAPEPEPQVTESAEAAPESGPEKVNGASDVDMTGWTPEQIDQYHKLGQKKAAAEAR